MNNNLKKKQKESIDLDKEANQENNNSHVENDIITLNNKNKSQTNKFIKKNSSNNNNFSPNKIKSPNLHKESINLKKQDSKLNENYEVSIPTSNNNKKMTSTCKK